MMSKKLTVLVALAVAAFLVAPSTLLAVDAAGAIKVMANQTGTAVDPSLSFSINPGPPAGYLDLANGAFVWRYGAQAGGAADGMANYVGYLKAGFNNGAWPLAGVTSTSAKNDGMTSLSVMDGATYTTTPRVGTGGSTVYWNTFYGYTVANTDILSSYTWNGDANMDGKVNTDDYVGIDAQFAVFGGLPDPSNVWSTGDFNHDGKVDTDDYIGIDAAFAVFPDQLLAGARPFPPVAGGGAQAVPEPGTLLLVLSGVVAAVFFGIRRRVRG